MTKEFCLETPFSDEELQYLEMAPADDEDQYDRFDHHEYRANCNRRRGADRAKMLERYRFEDTFSTDDHDNISAALEELYSLLWPIKNRIFIFEFLLPNTNERMEMLQNLLERAEKMGNNMGAAAFERHLRYDARKSIAALFSALLEKTDQASNRLDS